MSWRRWPLAAMLLAGCDANEGTARSACADFHCYMPVWSACQQWDGDIHDCSEGGPAPGACPTEEPFNGCRFGEETRCRVEIEYRDAAPSDRLRTFCEEQGGELFSGGPPIPFAEAR